MGLFSNLMHKGRLIKINTELATVNTALTSMPEEQIFRLGHFLKAAIADWDRPVMKQILRNPEATTRNCEASREMGLQMLAAGQRGVSTEAVLKGAAQWIIAVEKETANSTNEAFQTFNEQVNYLISQALGRIDSPKHSMQNILTELGSATDDITAAASSANDLEVGTKGAAAISAIIGAARDVYGLSVNPNTIFATYLSALEKQDFPKMTKITREMAAAIGRLKDLKLKGPLIYYWFTGQK